ncbi:FAD-dependent oxidoreductase [Mycolicibacillus trivialis]|uniref:FAD-binding domain-containing protein n=1 Tax=Mycolicibacillus trivialis TaxID=1798 RepID=A0A1X2ENL4_9MYCO|nr:FAD-dependent oxidoreductase [Mycolicibacillus trivialis]ORX07288.1 hypothetical protein AWC30_00630 [Mycolicibacillus trivialis]
MSAEAATDETTGVVIAGGGPAGMVLALLLARAGVAVTVLEKHADFLRDFRGDTVHASTLLLLDELGLGDRFAELPQRRIDSIVLRVQGVPVTVDVGAIRGPHPHIALVPQWDFLELLAGAAAAEPGFRLLRNAEVVDVLRDGARVTGVRYRDVDGRIRRLHAPLTVACDGRSSTVRQALGAAPRRFGVPMDVWWFRLPRRDSDPAGLAGVLDAGRAVIMIDRRDYYQIAYLIPKGRDAELRAAGIEALQRALVAQVPWLADRVDALSSFDEVKLLDVQLNRLRRWFRPGVLLLGDAAHAMSPVGGVGINLAVADAVAAARILAPPLRRGRVAGRHLLRVQARRWLPTVLVQTVQRVLHARVIAVAVTTADPAPPLLVRLAGRSPRLQRWAGYAVAVGPLPEHAPAFARRPRR